MFGSSARAASKTLIDSGRGNGGFETGEIAPWAPSLSGIGAGYTILTDAAVASEGTRYLRVQEYFNPYFLQQFAYEPGDGRSFDLSFDARVDAADAFDFAAVTVGAPTVNGKFVEAPALAAGEWRRFVYTWSFPQSKPTGNVSVGVGFFEQLGQFPNLKTGYLDNITLTQVPEPAAFGAAAGAVGSLLLCRHPRTRARGA